MDDKRIIKNIGMSLVLKPVSVALNLVITPLVLNYLGTEKYGVWAIILNIISWIYYFDIGIGNGLRNKATETISQEEYEKTKKYVSSAYFGTGIVAITFFIIIVVIWFLLNLDTFFRVELCDENINEIFVISIFFVCVNFVVSLSKTSTYAIQKPGLISLFDTISQVVQIGLLIIVINLFSNSLKMVALAYGFSGVLSGVFLYFTITRRRDFLVPSIKFIDKNYFAPLIALSLGFFILQICSLVLNTTDSLIISRIFGSADVTPYNIVFKVFGFFVQIHGLIIMPMWSAYTDAATKRNYDWIKKTIRKVNFISMLFSVGCIVMIWVFKPLMYIWLGKKLEYEFLMICCASIYSICQMFANNYSAFLCGIGYIRVSVILCAISAIVNIPLSVFLAKNCHMGISGVVLGSVIVMSTGVVAGPLLTNKWFNNNIEKC